MGCGCKKRKEKMAQVFSQAAKRLRRITNPSVAKAHKRSSGIRG